MMMGYLLHLCKLFCSREFVVDLVLTGDSTPSAVFLGLLMPAKPLEDLDPSFVLMATGLRCRACSFLIVPFVESVDKFMRETNQVLLSQPDGS